MPPAFEAQLQQQQQQQQHYQQHQQQRQQPGGSILLDQLPTSWHSFMVGPAAQQPQQGSTPHSRSAPCSARWAGDLTVGVLSGVALVVLNTGLVPQRHQGEMHEQVNKVKDKDSVQRSTLRKAADAAASDKS